MLNDAEWLARQWDAWTTQLKFLRPSEWAEEKRYLPQSASAFPGYYRYKITPFLREIVDCLSADSPVREITLMKGVQIGATVGVLENALGYFIDHVGCMPMMMVTADKELAETRVALSITTMLKESGLEHLIQSTDTENSRKTGKTKDRIEFAGGGFLMPLGAVNAAKLRSIPIQILFRDEIDGWPDATADGDQMDLSLARTKTYELSRKILNISTPTLKHKSRIEQRYMRSDQRRYFVCCFHCGFSQYLTWQEQVSSGEVLGIVWETERGNLVEDSVRYLCKNCAHEHREIDKARLFSPDHGAEWRPTAQSADPAHRGYHLSALYSQVQSWASGVRDYLEGWNTETNSPRDNKKLQVFFNNILGETFEEKGEQLKYETVSGHRRSIYQYGEIPNQFAERYCGGPASLLTSGVDVHGKLIKCTTWAWCRGHRTFLIDYHTFEGNTEDTKDKCWDQLREIIETKVYTANDGRIYKMNDQLMLIDSGYRSDQVYEFCDEYNAGVFPCRGLGGSPPKSARRKEFIEITTALNTTGYGIDVDIFKDRWNMRLKREWDGLAQQSEGHFNAPSDATTKQLRELTCEIRRQKTDPRTGLHVGWEWHRPNHAPNELWDTLMYATAALEIIAVEIMINQLGNLDVNWHEFWEVLEREQQYFSKGG